MPVPDPSLLILIPAYNEESRIEPTLRNYAQFFGAHYAGEFRLVVVLNGCRDNTLGVVQRVARDHPCISFLDFKAPIGKGGALIEIPVRIDNRKLASAIEIIGQSIGDQIDEYKKPWLDSRLPDGSRVAAAYPPLSPQGITLTIRKFLRHFTTEELVERGALTQEALAVLLDAIRQRKNILVAGGTSTGKTTQLNALVRHIHEDERIVTIEKPVEMKLLERNAVRLLPIPR